MARREQPLAQPAEGGALVSGHLVSPPSRAYLASFWGGQFNTDAGMSFSKYKRILGPGGFPGRGPADGKIASAGHADLAQLDEAGESRWHATAVGGHEPLEVTWSFAEVLPAASFAYFLTTSAYRPGDVLRRALLEDLLFEEVSQDSTTFLSHFIELPKDRAGRHVLLAIWNLSDRDEAYYSVADLDIKPSDY
ncbi:lytic polysaccharide monooxygenase auxiliary activity family 9 protein [Streptomyces californicus]|uniref:lytic polysaccharide monooxygenase auxiliary activity family 9 protein n=1 Tax=Streptomyces californicus TaxID=67351 RepID=UPI00296F1379|nr:lytic polysaccharide monooxygenase auxiliary activity family 9 protein [Streptomyces californicus]MDW4917714.1 lytic polysaccharide monooxygenase auxiliary activity family 9 protein [Streptomyces californicus]